MLRSVPEFRNLYLVHLSLHLSMLGMCVYFEIHDGTKVLGILASGLLLSVEGTSDWFNYQHESNWRECESRKKYGNRRKPYERMEWNATNYSVYFQYFLQCLLHYSLERVETRDQFSLFPRFLPLSNI